MIIVLVGCSESNKICNQDLSNNNLDFNTSHNTIKEMMGYERSGDQDNEFETYYFQLEESIYTNTVGVPKVICVIDNTVFAYSVFYKLSTIEQSQELMNLILLDCGEEKIDSIYRGKSLSWGNEKVDYKLYLSEYDVLNTVIFNCEEKK